MSKKRGNPRGSDSSGSRFSSKGQITIFIIIGIIILFVFAAVLFVTKTVTKEPLLAASEPVISDVPTVFAPVQSYTHACLAQVTKQGLRRLGEQGGYIFPEVVGEFSATKPTESDGLLLGSTRVPYWHYNALPNQAGKIGFASHKPPLTGSSLLSVQSQLERYVYEKLDDCLHDYVVFEEQGFDVEMSGRDVEVRIGDGFVGVVLDMPLDVAKGDADAEMDIFYSKIPLDLKKYYTIAGNILVMEQNYSFMERQVLDLIQVYSATDREKLPPTSAATFEFAPSISWSTHDVETNIKQMLASNVPLLRFSGTNNFYRHQYPVSDLSGLYQQNYDNMILPLEQAGDLDVRFDYLNWNPYIHVNDKGGVIQPSHTAVNFWILHFGMQDYATYYDISHPALVTIRDDQALDGEGYSFVIALESNVRDNLVAEDKQDVPAPVAVFSESMLCNENQRDTELLKTVVVDSFTGDPIPAVQIGFSVPDQADCTMGVTDTGGEFESTYPAVYGGVLSLLKDGYLTTFYPLDTQPYTERSAVIGAAIAGVHEPAFNLYPIKEMDVRITKKSIGKCINSRCIYDGFSTPSENKKVFSVKPDLRGGTHGWYYTGARRDLEDYEQGLITLERVSDLQDGVYSEDFTAVAAVGNGEGQPIRLVPGVYKVSGMIISEAEVVIPEEERCSDGISEMIACRDTDGCCITLDEVKMDAFVTGQIEWETPETYLTITPEQLYGSQEIEFFVPTVDIQSVPPGDRIVEDLEVMGELAGASQRFQERLLPQFR